VTAPEGDEVVVSIMVDYGQFYLYDVEHGSPESIDAVAEAWLHERKAGPADHGVIVYTDKQVGETMVTVRLLESLATADPTADHQVELSFTIPSGWLGVYAWGDLEPSALLAVPRDPLRCRVSWTGLGHGTPLADEPPSPEALTIEVAPGDAADPAVLRSWPAWAPPPTHQTTAPTGMRELSGPGAAEARQAMEWVPLLFWPPYPETSSGTVTGLWRDPADGTHWANGSGRNSRDVLRELTPAEVEELKAQGFPSVRTYAIDVDGRIWTSDVMPLERVPCLNLVPQWQFEAIRGMSGGLVGTAVIDLPPGWGRIVQRQRDTRQLVGEVERVDDDPAFDYQRWRDDQPGPTQ
jgi:hypothetical protein